MAHADVAAHLLHSGAGGFPGGFPRFFLAVHLLQQGVLAVFGQLALLFGHRIPGFFGGGAGLPQAGQLLRRSAALEVLVLVVGGFQVLLGLGGGAGALG